MRAPSSFNNQCWNFSVVTGEPLAAIRQGNTDGILGGKPDSREFRRFDGVADDHRARQIEIAKQLFGAMGIAREDKDARSEEHTSELQSLMRISYAVFCLKKNSKNRETHKTTS